MEAAKKRALEEDERRLAAEAEAREKVTVGSYCMYLVVANVASCRSARRERCA